MRTRANSGGAMKLCLTSGLIGLMWYFGVVHSGAILPDMRMGSGIEMVTVVADSVMEDDNRIRKDLFPSNLQHVMATQVVRMGDKQIIPVILIGRNLAVPIFKVGNLYCIPMLKSPSQGKSVIPLVPLDNKTLRTANQMADQFALLPRSPEVDSLFLPLQTALTPDSEKNPDVRLMFQPILKVDSDGPTSDVLELRLLRDEVVSRVKPDDSLAQGVVTLSNALTEAVAAPFLKVRSFILSSFAEANSKIIDPLVSAKNQLVTDSQNSIRNTINQASDAFRDLSFDAGFHSHFQASKRAGGPFELVFSNRGSLFEGNLKRNQQVFNLFNLLSDNASATAEAPALETDKQVVLLDLGLGATSVFKFPNGTELTNATDTSEREEHSLCLNLDRRCCRRNCGCRPWHCRPLWCTRRCPRVVRIRIAQSNESMTENDKLEDEKEDEDEGLDERDAALRCPYQDVRCCRRDCRCRPRHCRPRLCRGRCLFRTGFQQQSPVQNSQPGPEDNTEEMEGMEDDGDAEEEPGTNEDRSGHQLSPRCLRDPRCCRRNCRRRPLYCRPPRCGCQFASCLFCRTNPWSRCCRFHPCRRFRGPGVRTRLSLETAVSQVLVSELVNNFSVNALTLVAAAQNAESIVALIHNETASTNMSSEREQQTMGVKKALIIFLGNQLLGDPIGKLIRGGQDNSSSPNASANLETELTDLMCTTSFTPAELNEELEKALLDLCQKGSEDLGGQEVPRVAQQLFPPLPHFPARPPQWFWRRQRSQRWIRRFCRWNPWHQLCFNWRWMWGHSGGEDLDDNSDLMGLRSAQRWRWRQSAEEDFDDSDLMGLRAAQRWRWPQSAEEDLDDDPDLMGLRAAQRWRWPQSAEEDLDDDPALVGLRAAQRWRWPQSAEEGSFTDDLDEENLKHLSQSQTKDQDKKLVSEEDRAAQRWIWRQSLDKPLENESVDEETVEVGEMEEEDLDKPTGGDLPAPGAGGNPARSGQAFNPYARPYRLPAWNRLPAYSRRLFLPAPYFYGYTYPRPFY